MIDRFFLLTIALWPMTFIGAEVVRHDIGEGSVRIQADGTVQVSGDRHDPRCRDPFGNVWSAELDQNGTLKDVGVSTFANPSVRTRIGLPSSVSGRWMGMAADDVGYVWLATTESVVQIDPRKTNGVIHVFRPPQGASATAMETIANRQLLIGCSDGRIWEVTTRPKSEPSFTLVERISRQPVRAMRFNPDGTLWVVAGSDLCRSDSLQQDWQDSWRELSRMPAGNHDNIFAEIGDRFYSAGGKTFFGWPASQWVNLDHIWSFDKTSGSWAVEAPMLESGKAYLGIGALNNELWLIGGYFRAERGTKATDTVEIYNPKNNSSRLGPKYPAARGQIVALNVGERIYAVGGEGNKVASPETFSIGIGQNEWQPEPPAPGPVTQAAGCVIGKKFYIAAGPRSDCPGLFVYDSVAKKWSTVKHPAEQAPAAPLVTAWRDEVWVMGGRGKSSGEKAVWAYSTKTGKWRKGPDLPLPVSWGAAAVHRDFIMIAGGAYRDEAVGNYFNSDRTFLYRPDPTP